MTPETKTEARERMDAPEKLGEDEMKRLGFAICDRSVEQPVAASLFAEARRARASEASLTAALSALRAEHQRLSKDAEWFRRQRDDALALVDMKERVIAEVTKERDDWKARFAQFEPKDMLLMELDIKILELKAALAASEEKARNALCNAMKMSAEISPMLEREWRFKEVLKDIQTHALFSLCSCKTIEECHRKVADLSERVSPWITSSPAPGAMPCGAWSESLAGACELPAGHYGRHCSKGDEFGTVAPWSPAPRVGAESEGPEDTWPRWEPEVPNFSDGDEASDE